MLIPSPGVWGGYILETTSAGERESVDTVGGISHKGKRGIVCEMK
jgi:hypothetical protein